MITVYQNVQDMTGYGEEWLVDAKDNVRAVFFNGNMICEVYQFPGNGEVTKGAKNG